MIYTNLDVLIDLYKGGDLPADEMAFQYNGPNGKPIWIHRDELARAVTMTQLYPQANTQKGKK